MNSFHCLISHTSSDLRLFHATIFQTCYEYIILLLEWLKVKAWYGSFSLFYKVKEGMFKKLLHDPRHSFCNLSKGQKAKEDLICHSSGFATYFS